jgi:hypothetical protein
MEMKKIHLFLFTITKHCASFDPMLILKDCSVGLPAKAGSTDGAGPVLDGLFSGGKNVGGHFSDASGTC